MSTSYTDLLGLALPVQGELSGQWGDVVNNYITTYLDSAVGGTQVISGNQTAVTLSKTTATSLSQVGSGATGSSQYQVINCTGNPASTLTITVSYPSLTNAQFSKSYIVVNATSTSQSVVVRATTGSGTSTGVTLVSGERAVLAWNGSDFVKVASSVADGVTTISFGSTGLTPNTSTSGAVTVAGTLGATNGGTSFSTYATGDTIYASASNTLSKLTVGSTGQVLTVAGGVPTWATPASGLPSQTGNAGKYLTTDGTNASWTETGAAAGGAIYVNNTTISANYTIAAGQNGFSVGPITQAPGVVVTITAGQRWVVL